MVPELRKRHRMVWQVWAFLLPVGFVLAILVLPKKGWQPNLIENTPIALPNLEQTQENEWLVASIRTQPALSDKQLEIKLKKPLNIPSAQVFWQNAFLGSLGAKGTQRFGLDSALLVKPPFLLEIRNPIDQTVFQKIMFKK